MSQCNLENKDEWLSFVGPFSTRTQKLKSLNKYGRIEKLSLTKQPLLTAKLASNFFELQSVREFWLWCSVTRIAMRHVITIPGLEKLSILAIKQPGRLKNFAAANSLKVFSCNFMSEADLLEISNLPILQELHAQNSTLTPKALDALLQMPTLEHLDLEATAFDDEMAAIVAESKTIKHLDVGALRLTSKGLQQLSKMSQLRSLDIWAIDVGESDLDCLSKLSELEYLSIGGYYEQTILTAKGVLPRLKEIPSLKKIWLDGIVLTESEKKTLKEQYEYVQVS